jgi:phosphate transport system substrate-binding protein
MQRFRFAALVVAAVAAAASTAVALGSGDARRPLSGTISADGSSTVGPWTTAAAERFRRRQPRVRITVAVSGTGGGFERFCRGETDLSNASRPIKQSEAARCADNDVDWVVFHVANDGIAIVTNRASTWVSCLTVEELRKIWDSGSSVDSWNDVRGGFPNVPLKLFGPGTDSGTFDFFTEKINGRARRSRPDYTASENDNVLVRGVANERGSLGYFGLSYYEANRSRLRLIRVNGGNGCVAPSRATVQNRTYRPLSRPLFIYARKSSFQHAAVRAFIGFALNNQASIARAARFVPLTAKQARKSRRVYRNAIS